jgi:hypothetical protein
MQRAVPSESLHFCLGNFLPSIVVIWVSLAKMGSNVPHYFQVFLGEWQSHLDTCHSKQTGSVSEEGEETNTGWAKEQQGPPSFIEDTKYQSIAKATKSPPRSRICSESTGCNLPDITQTTAPG